jgi:hypothetical protein
VIANLTEELARKICGLVQAEAYDDLPDVATYIQRKSTDRPILDKEEAKWVATEILAMVREKTAKTF